MKGYVGSSFIITDKKMNARHPSDFYPTPWSLVEAMVDFVLAKNSKWRKGQGAIKIADLGAGSGRFGTVLRDRMPDVDLYAFEVQYPNGLPPKLRKVYDSLLGDFYTTQIRDNIFDMVIGNPPFSMYSNTGFWNHLFSLVKPNGLAFLLGQGRLNYGEGRSEELWRTKREVAEVCLAKRPSWYPEGHPRCGDTMPTEYSLFLIRNAPPVASLIEKHRWTKENFVNDNQYTGKFAGTDTWQMMEEMGLHHVTVDAPTDPGSDD